LFQLLTCAPGDVVGSSSSDVSFLVPSALLTPKTGAHKRTLDIRNLVPSALLTPEIGAYKRTLDIRNLVPSALLTPETGAHKRTLDIRSSKKKPLNLISRCRFARALCKRTA
jgi:hypothetical protein